MNLADFNCTKLVQCEEYMLRYEEDSTVTEYKQTGIYRMVNGKLKKDAKVYISGDSYFKINTSAGVTEGVDARYGITIDRYDSKGRDVVEIIKRSIVEWKKLK